MSMMLNNKDQTKDKSISKYHYEFHYVTIQMDDHVWDGRKVVNYNYNKFYFQFTSIIDTKSHTFLYSRLQLKWTVTKCC